MDEVGEIFRIKKGLLNFWETLKCDAYVHFAVIKLILLFNKLVYQVVESPWLHLTDYSTIGLP